MFELFAHFMHLGVTADELEAAYIEFVLDNSHKQSAAYSLLNISRKTLDNKKKKQKRIEMGLEP